MPVWAIALSMAFVLVIVFGGAYLLKREKQNDGVQKTGEGPSTGKTSQKNKVVTKIQTALPEIPDHETRRETFISGKEIDPKDGVSNFTELVHFSHTIMEYAYRNDGITLLQAQRLTKLFSLEAEKVMENLSMMGAVAMEPAKSKYVPVVEKADWFDKYYRFHEGNYEEVEWFGSLL